MHQEKHIEMIPAAAASAGTIAEPEGTSTNPLQVYSYRYVCAVLFVLGAIINSFPTNTLVAASAAVEALYGQPKAVIALSSLADNLMIPFVFFPSSYLLDHVGLKAGLNVACFAMCVGSIIRLFINVSFGVYVFGTFVTTIGSIIFISSPIKFVMNWFPIKQVPVVDAIVLFALYSSDAVGVFMSGLMIGDDSTKQEIFTLVLVQTLMAVAIHLFILCFFKERPPTPANHSSQQRFGEGLWRSIKDLFRNRNYMKLFASMMLVRGSVGGVVAVLSWVMLPYGFGTTDVAYSLVSTVVMGMVGCLIVGFLLKKTQKYRLICMICAFGEVFFISMLLVTFETSTIVSVCIVSALSGFLMYPFLATSVELSTELAFPVGDATSSGLVLMGGELFGFVAGMIFEAIVDGESKARSRTVMLLGIGCLLIGALALLCVKEDLRKHRYQKEQSNKEQEMLELPDEKYVDSEK